MKKKYYTPFIFICFLYACSENPIKLEPINNDNSALLEKSEVFGKDEQQTGHNHQENDIQENQLHKITALEVLNTDKYVYVRAKENENEYWLATNKRKIVIGNTYYYTGGYPQKNFPSKEFKKVFPELILVNSLVEEDHGKAVK